MHRHTARADPRHQGGEGVAGTPGVRLPGVLPPEFGATVRVAGQTPSCNTNGPNHHHHNHHDTSQPPQHNTTSATHQRHHHVDRERKKDAQPPCVKTAQFAHLLPSLEVGAVSQAKSTDSSPQAISNLSRTRPTEERKCGAVRCSAVLCVVVLFVPCDVVCVCVCLFACCCVRVVSKTIKCVKGGIYRQPVHIISYDSKLPKKWLLRDCISIRKPGTVLYREPCLVLPLNFSRPLVSS